MVAHIIYSALDAELAATVSKTVMNYLRKDMKVNQFLIADDISMLALEKYGNLADRAVKTLDAGCDATLYCAGNLKEMEQVMADVPTMTPISFERYERSNIRRRSAASA
jgi:beta-N-acetylhexosaminidase